MNNIPDLIRRSTWKTPELRESAAKLVQIIVEENAGPVSDIELSCGLLSDVLAIVNSALKTQSKDIQDWKDDMARIHDLLPNDAFLDRSAIRALAGPK